MCKIAENAIIICKYDEKRAVDVEDFSKINISVPKDGPIGIEGDPQASSFRHNKTADGDHGK